MKLFSRKVTILFLALACSSFACERANYYDNRVQSSVAEPNVPIQKKSNQYANANIVAQAQSLPKIQTNNNMNSSIDNEFLISNAQLGKVRLGMQLKEIKRLYPGAALKVVTDTLGDGTSEIEVRQNGEKLFYFTTENFDDVETEELPAETDKIDFLMTDNKHFTTAEGIKCGQTFGDAQKKYGAPKFFAESAYDFIVFENSAIKAAAFYNLHSGQTTGNSYSPQTPITFIGIGKELK